MTYNPASWYRPCPTRGCGARLGHSARRCHYCGLELRPPDGRTTRHRTPAAQARRLARRVKRVLDEFDGAVARAAADYEEE